MKLFNIPEGSKIIADVTDNKGITNEAVITFHRLDGAYSYCTLPDGGTVHLSVMTPLIEIDSKPGHYRIEDKTS